MARLDALLGRVQMYRLVSLALAVIAAIAVVESLAGVLGFPVLDLLASLATVLVACVVANRVMALLFRVRPHTESSIITALLLFFLFFPTSDGQELLTVALVSAIAVASKYVIAWRGRHIFNPAAIGAVIITLTQLNASVWWVATPVLLPFVVIGAALVLYRTRQLPMGVAFIVVATILTAVTQASFGRALPDALVYALGSTPILFLAGFMLTEPLTLPPRQWQRLALAAVVGVLFSVPFSIGPVFSSPELALVVGNLLAFLVGQRRGVSLEFASAEQLTPSTTEFTFSSHRPVSFRAGQYIELSVPHSGADRSGTRRVFSIASAPSNPHEVRVGVRMGESPSSFKRALGSLRPGQKIRANLVAGDFLLPTDRARKVLLVAGGIGITPFISQLEHDAAESEARDLVLFYAVREHTELAYFETLRRLGTRVVLLAPESPSQLPDGWAYAGSGRITADVIEKYVPDFAERVSFVSGPPRLVGAVRTTLRRMGVRRVKTDAFSGY
ncbi:FAD-dependent oxidoreductase [Agreia sp. COWG]|uniref:FAD-dependent oxidoreductase n=1 Tax=Agreia sp. COWG TaxID=2773266 RepID=UPI00192906F1|nr:oxidoreductase [Agreia sp. COWG]CAD5996009.1 FAD-binding FR-type domain-containing protein [Agreia sp. COWG]